MQDPQIHVCASEQRTYIVLSRSNSRKLSPDAFFTKLAPKHAKLKDVDHNTDNRVKLIPISFECLSSPNGILRKFGVSRPQNLDDEAAWISQYCKGKRVKHPMVTLGLLATMHPIWGKRNCRIFKM